MPVGTIGTVKALDITDLKTAGATIMLSNTYHLLLRPGAEEVAARGGLHRFIGGDLPILTDSGGYQVMSLADLRDYDEDGVTFKSHLDGSKVRLTPEVAVRVQNLLGSDIQMVLDVCPPADAKPGEAQAATELSHRWAERAFACDRPDGVLRFAICQGGFDAAARAASSRFVAGLPADGFAIGGLSVGEPEDVMMAMLDAALPELPTDRPRYLMGVGKPSQIVRAVARGVDLFDCVLPTRVARHGTLWTTVGVIRINRNEFATDDGPLDPGCPCLTCAGHSRAYLRHIYRCGDPLYLRLASLHNLTYLLSLMARIRADLAADRFDPALTLEGLAL